MKHDQFTLPFLDTTIVAEGFGLYGRFPTAKSSAYAQINVEPEEAEPLDAPIPTKPSLPAQDYRLAGERCLADSWKARAEDNLAAIRIMTTIEAEARHARPEEQERLARFTAFGASDLADRIFRRAGDSFAPAWEDLGIELEGLVSRDDLANLKRATQYAHYTPEFMIRAIWRTLRRMGFDGGRVLEPGCGTGLFFALSPEALAGKLALTGVEMDPTTARIAKLLYPNARIRHEDFTKARLPELYDLAIGNPPFSDRTVRADDPAGELRLSLHVYFIARSVERLRPGGLAAFVTSRWTMDKVDGKARQRIAAMADLIGAVRLPEGAMHDRAGTEVVVDILFLQKRGAGTAPAGAAWDVLAEAVPAEDCEAALSINRYFVEHPEMALGTHARTSSAYGPVYTLKPVLSTPGALSDLLAQALDRLPRDLFKAVVGEPKPAFHATVRVGTAADGAAIKEGSYLAHEGVLVQIIGGEPTAVAVRDGKGTEGIPAKHARIIRSLIAVRDAVREVLRTQANDEPWGAAQIRLRSAYALFVRNFGPINLTTISETVTAEGETRETFRRANLQPFLDDPDVWLVASIEDYDLESGTAKHRPIFRERVLHPEMTPVIETAEDALAVTLHETGLVDLDRVAELLGQSRETAIAELGERIFADPEATAAMNCEVWVTADAYLSGKIRDKLTAAQAAAALDPRYQRNVAALEKTLPEDLKPSDITARLGAPWIPADAVAAFAEEILGVNTAVYHTVEIASWSINVHAFAGLASSSTDWGTSRRHAGELLMDALNASLPQIYDEFEEDGVKKRVLNAADTEAAKDKLMKIKAAFETWVWKDVERADRLARIYNDRFNNLVPRHFDGSHLTIPGASSVISFYAHQKRAIWRIVASGTTYVAHAVGAGKTFSLAAAIMEQKRLGLITKAMMVVPGHCLAQASREFLQLYPTARILVADETNFVKDKRQRFLARAATAQWDCIIITHSAFKFIPAPADFERRLIADQIQSYSDLLERVDGADRLSRKRIERMKEGLEEDLERLKSRKDDMLTIAEIGVDQLIVDEMQEFRKLSFATNQTTLKGIDPEGSQRAWDLYVKTRFIDSTTNPGRALIAASGTPIANSLAELFTVQRFVQPDALQERGIQQFDAWAANFGETRTELELQPSGLYKPVTRFCEFVNVPDLMAIYRMATDVVLKSDLRQYLKLPAIAGGRRQIVAAPAGEAFLSYQRHLAERIKAIEQRNRKPQKGDDILLSVITDGRHAAIDLRFVKSGCDNEPDNKLNALIDNVHRIWEQTANARYTRPDGIPYALPGAAQMIFSDLGTLAAEETRGFSAYRWIKDSLVARGVPGSQIAFMQDYKKSSAKHRLFNAVNGGQVRIVIGSSETMGTGVNAQRRLKALHHLDVPWLPSQIEQREGRIERQGNENDEIELYAYATKRSVDATGWQILERKARFIDAAMSGDRSLRRIEDAGSQANQFALAKAIASGDERLMRKAGIAAEIARLERLRDSHSDDQFVIRRKIGFGEKHLEDAMRQIDAIIQDLAQRITTRGDAFTMTIGDRRITERKVAGEALIAFARKMKPQKPGSVTAIGAIGGFPILARASYFDDIEFRLDRAATSSEHILCEKGDSPLGLVSRLESALGRFEVELAEERRTVAEVSNWLPGFKARRGDAFPHVLELEEKRAEMAELDASLAATAPETNAAA
jgi:N12 class adenine-specific DNA methylase/predicted RNA methylase